ncbi:MAG: NUDIX hydrolase [Deltaproteobacteria bacterium]|nr:NUDIX hydrolase [Deltaproteobacteria bacterium]
MSEPLICPHCQGMVQRYRSPALTVDIIIEIEGQGIVLIERLNPPLGWALPGGYVDYGETLEQAACREALEETSLEVEELRQFRAYSDPNRDPRQHSVTHVFLAKAQGIPRGRDDARRAEVFWATRLPAPLAFDHAKIINDYFEFTASKGCELASKGGE